MIFDCRLLWQTVSNAADKSTATQIVRSGGFLWLNPIAISVVICSKGGPVIWSKTVLVWSWLEIFVANVQNQRIQYFRGWAEKRDRPIRRSYGSVLARFRYWENALLFLQLSIALLTRSVVNVYAIPLCLPCY